MKNAIQQLQTIISEYKLKFENISDADFSDKPLPQKWSRKEVLGICAILANMPKENYKQQSNSGTLHTLEWLAEDYVKHLKHHINQIISGPFDVIYK